MKTLLAVLLVALLAPELSARSAAAAPSKAVCLVCKVTEGEAEEEPVKAVRLHEGKEYGFCSEGCAKAFTEDPAAYLPPAFPRAAPSFELKDLSGKVVSNQSLRGRVVLVDFWATWCVPCRKSMPELQAMHDKFGSRGLSVIGVSIDEGGAAKVRKFVVARKLTYSIALDSERSPAWEAFRVKAIPAAYLIDRDGEIVAQWTGAPPAAKDLEIQLEKLLATD